MEASFGILNSNTNMISNVNLYLRSSSTGYFQQSFNITSIRYNPYVFSTDKVRLFWEFIAIALLLIMIIQDAWRIMRNISSLKIHLRPPAEEGMSKARIIFAKLWRKVFQIFSKLMFGFSNYLKDFGTVLSFVGMILSVIVSVYWFTYLARLDQMHAIDFTDPKKDSVMIRSIILLRTITDSYINYRKIAGLLIGIYFLRLIIIVFELFPRLSYSWRCLINSFLNNCYFLFFLFMINMGVSLFAHFYFGGRLEVFSTLFTSFIVIFATILGYTDGIMQMLDLEPVGATIALEAYYFLVIMILINMFIIFVNSEYKKLEEEREQKEEQAKRTLNPLDYAPFFLYEIKEQWRKLISYKIYSVFNRKKFIEMRELRKTERLMRSMQDKDLGEKNWDIDFQRFVDIDFKTNNSLGIITKISHSEIEELLKNKQFNYYWRFISLFLLLVFHMLEVFIIYAPLQKDYSIMIGKVQVVLGRSYLTNSNFNGNLNPTPYGDLQMRVFTSELMSYLLSNDVYRQKPLTLFQVFLPTPTLKPVGNFIFSFQNVQVSRAQYVEQSINNIAAYRYMDYSKSGASQLQYLTTLPSTAQDFQMKYTLPENPEVFSDFNPPSFNYVISEKNGVTRTVALIDSNVIISDPYFIKLVGDNVLGSETKSVSAKTVLYNSDTQYYLLTELLLTKTFGDMYDVYLEYGQIPKTSILLSGGMGLPLAMIVKFIIFFGLIYYSVSRIKNSWMEYEIWYKIRIANELPSYLLQHRNRKMPELFRKLRSLFGFEDILLVISSGIYFVFFVSLIVTAAGAETFKTLADSARKDPTRSLEMYDQAEKEISLKFVLDCLAGIEMFVLTVQVLMSMRQLKMFRVIMQSFSIILDSLTGLLILMVLILFGFSFMMHILLGEKYKEFENPFYIHRFTGILISFKQLVTYTDNFDTFMTLVFMLPYFLMVKFTMLYLVIAVIYNSIGKAQKEVEASEVYTTRYLTYKEIWQRTMQKISKHAHVQKEQKYGQLNTSKYINTLNFNTHVEVFNRLIDSIHFTEGKNDITSWKKLLGEATIAEFIEREKISNKHQELVFHLLNFTVQNRKNFFVAAKEVAQSEVMKAAKEAEKDSKKSGLLRQQSSFQEKSLEQMKSEPQKGERNKEYEAMLKRLLNFYKSFFNYFRYGHNRLMKQMSLEYGNIDSNKKSLEAKEFEEQTKNALKSEIGMLHEKIERQVAKSLIYWRILKAQKEEATEPERPREPRTQGRQPTLLPMNLAESILPDSPVHRQFKDLRDGR